jgi:hypothetical protein
VLHGIFTVVQGGAATLARDQDRDGAVLQRAVTAAWSVISEPPQGRRQDDELSLRERDLLERQRILC